MAEECDLKEGQYKRLETCADMDPEGQSTLCQVVIFILRAGMSHRSPLSRQETGLFLHSEKITQVVSGKQTEMGKE